jgi:hypothetical protein
MFPAGVFSISTCLLGKAAPVWDLNTGHHLRHIACKPVFLFCHDHVFRRIDQTDQTTKPESTQYSKPLKRIESIRSAIRCGKNMKKGDGICDKFDAKD